MIHVHYNSITGEVIWAYHDSCSDIPTPNIVIGDEDWSSISALTSKHVDLATLSLVYDTEELNNINSSYQISEIDAQIEAIEVKTYRPLREIALGIDDGTATTNLLEYNTQITNLRIKRASLLS